jgi:hypothetical protein
VIRKRHDQQRLVDPVDDLARRKRRAAHQLMRRCVCERRDVMNPFLFEPFLHVRSNTAQHRQWLRAQRLCRTPAEEATNLHLHKSCELARQHSRHEEHRVACERPARAGSTLQQQRRHAATDRTQHAHGRRPHRHSGCDVPTKRAFREQKDDVHVSARKAIRSAAQDLKSPITGGPIREFRELRSPIQPGQIGIRVCDSRDRQSGEQNDEHRRTV